MSNAKLKYLKKVQKYPPPRIEDYPDMPDAERAALQSLLTAPMSWLDRAKKRHPVGTRRKIYFFFRMRGLDHRKAMAKAGYRKLDEHAALADPQGQALRRMYRTDQVDLNYILDRLIERVEDGKNENAKVRALDLISKLKGYLIDRQEININEHMQVSFSFSGPSICPHCKRSTIPAGDEPPQQIPARVTNAEWEDGDRPHQADQAEPESAPETG